MKNARQVSVVYAALLALAGFSLLVYLSVHTQLEVANVSAVVGFTLFGIVVVLFGFPAPHVGHVSHVDNGAVDVLDGDVVKVVR